MGAFRSVRVVWIRRGPPLVIVPECPERDDLAAIIELDDVDDVEFMRGAHEFKAKRKGDSHFVPSRGDDRALQGGGRAGASETLLEEGRYGVQADNVCPGWTTHRVFDRDRIRKEGENGLQILLAHKPEVAQHDFAHGFGRRHGLLGLVGVAPVASG